MRACIREAPCEARSSAARSVRRGVLAVAGGRRGDGSRARRRRRAPSGAGRSSAPVTERLISGPTRPEVAAWGLAYNPVTDEMIVGDYVANQIRRYTPRRHVPRRLHQPRQRRREHRLRGRGRPARRFGVRGGDEPDLAVRHPEVRQARQLPVRLQGVPDRVAWLTVDDQGYVWFPDAYGSYKIYKYSVNDATKKATQVLVRPARRAAVPASRCSSTASTPSDSGDIYTADAINRRCTCIGSNGVWKRDIGGPSVFTGDLRGVVVDDTSGRLYVSDAKAGEIDVFDLAGNYLLSIGSQGDRARAVRLRRAPDRGHARRPRLGRRLQRVPRPRVRRRRHLPVAVPVAAGAARTRTRSSSRGVVGVDQATGDVLTADHWGQRIQRFDAAGQPRSGSSVGAGREPEDSVNYPRAVATDPATGHVWVLNAEGAPYLVEYDQRLQRACARSSPTTSRPGSRSVNGEVYVGYRSRGHPGLQRGHRRAAALVGPGR